MWREVLVGMRVIKLMLALSCKRVYFLTKRSPPHTVTSVISVRTLLPSIHLTALRIKLELCVSWPVALSLTVNLVRWATVPPFCSASSHLRISELLCRLNSL